MDESHLKGKIKMKPQSSPWGKSQQINKIAPGIAFVSTAGHGGYRVAKKFDIAHRDRLSKRFRRNRTSWFHSNAIFVIAMIESVGTPQCELDQSRDP